MPFETFRVDDPRPSSAKPAAPRRIAVVGTGIAGLAAAWLLSKRHRVTVFESQARLGGHSHTVDVEVAGRKVAVDAGFIVYNRRNYPNLEALFGHLGVATQPSDMSFSVSLGPGALEYSGCGVRGLLARKRNLIDRRFWRLMRDLAAFYAIRPPRFDLAALGDLSFGAFLARSGWRGPLVDDHLLPMAAAIWSCPVGEVAHFPAATVLAFFANHGLIGIGNRPPWRTVAGGSRRYVERLARSIADNGGHIRLASPVRSVIRRAAGVSVVTDGGVAESFDSLVVATHADQALPLLSDATAAERGILGAFQYERNEAVLHSDPRLMPAARPAWASWNFLSRKAGQDAAKVSVTYWMNRLHDVPTADPILLTLNPILEPAAGLEHRRFVYHHPRFESAAWAPQPGLGALQGVRDTWFCGSYFGYGFHEDALVSAIGVARRLGVPTPWPSPPALAGSEMAAQ